MCVHGDVVRSYNALMFFFFFFTLLDGKYVLSLRVPSKKAIVLVVSSRHVELLY